MGRPRKNQTVKVVNENDEVVEVAEVGIPGLFQPQQCDISEEMQGNEAFLQYARDREDTNSAF